MTDLDLLFEFVELPENERDLLILETIEEDFSLTPVWKSNFINTGNEDKIRLLRSLDSRNYAVVNSINLLEFIIAFSAIDRIMGHIPHRIDDYTMQ